MVSSCDEFVTMSFVDFFFLLRLRVTDDDENVSVAMMTKRNELLVGA